MDIESGLTPSTNEICEAVSKTPGFTRFLSVLLFGNVISSILRFGAGKPPWHATEELQPPDEEHPRQLPTKTVKKDEASTTDSRPSTTSPSRAEDVLPDPVIGNTTLLQSPHHSDDEGSTISSVVLPSQPLLSDPIVVNLRQQELGKTVLGVAVPVTTALIVYCFTQKSPPAIVRFTPVALSIGCTAIWNGLLLRETYPRTANAAEQIGIAIVLLSFHGLVGSFLPPKLLWIPGLFGSLAVVPFVLAALPPNQNHTR